jgi:hypothetical protein
MAVILGLGPPSPLRRLMCLAPQPGKTSKRGTGYLILDDSRRKSTRKRGFLEILNKKPKGAVYSGHCCSWTGGTSDAKVSLPYFLVALLTPLLMAPAHPVRERSRIFFGLLGMASVQGGKQGLPPAAAAATAAATAAAMASLTPAEAAAVNRYNISSRRSDNSSSDSGSSL